MMEHLLPDSFLRNKVKILVVGAGGTGSKLMSLLGTMHRALLAFGHPSGFHVTLIDDDIVSETNLLRQAFIPCDIGKYKAPVIVDRINLTFGLEWISVIDRLEPNDDLNGFDIVIGCVDTRKARQAIYKASNRCNVRYWFDCGNGLADGQCILGELENQFSKIKKPNRLRLPHAADLYPEMLDASLDEEDEMPSCSMVEALEKQSLFVNSEVVISVANILFEFFRFGKISFHGNFFNQKVGKKLPLMVDPEAWARMGYTGEVKAKKVKAAKKK